MPVSRFVLGLVLAAAPMRATAATIDVPDDQPTIQAAVDAAQSGEECGGFGEPPRPDSLDWSTRVLHPKREHSGLFGMVPDFVGAKRSEDEAFPTAALDLKTGGPGLLNEALR